MPSTTTPPVDKLTLQPHKHSQQPISPPLSDSNNNTHHHHTDKGKGTTTGGSGSGSSRPIITPSSLSATRRAAATTRSFSSLSAATGGSATGSAAVPSPSLLAPPPTLAIIAPTPEASPITPSTPSRRVHHKSVPETPSSVLRNPGLGGGGDGYLAPVMQKSYSAGSTAGKRKAEDVEGEPGNTTPPKHKATFAPEPRPHRASSASNAPSSYRRKRARLSLPSTDGSNPPSRPNTAMSSVAESPNAKTTGSWSSKRGSTRGSVQGSSTPFPQPHQPATSTHTRNGSSQNHGGGGDPSASNASHSVIYPFHPTPSRRSLSQASIPLSALISPHAPSVTHSGRFHMRDPRRPAPIQSTAWSLSLPSRVEDGQSRWDFRGWVERGGSPLHSWLFFIGFIVFPLWWVASFVGVPQTRRLGEGAQEKGVVLDDPQVEHDSRSWRRRCRVMAGVSFITYIPFIVLVIVFAR